MIKSSLKNRQQKTVVFILSTNYAGSHYLSLMLGSHSKALHLGEVRHMIRAKSKCFVCGDFCKCNLFNGIDTVKKNMIYPTFFSRTSPDINTLIDNTKKIRWANHFIENQQYRFKFIHLIRDPRALTRRWMIGYPKFEDILNQKIKSIRSYPSKFLLIAFGSLAYTYVFKWLQLNERITEFLSLHNLDSYVVTYRDLALDRANQINKITTWLGLPFEETQLEYWKFQHHGTQKIDYEWVKEKKTTYFDLRWQDYLSDSQKHIISTNKQVQDYIKKIGVDIQEDGLTKAK